MVDVNTEALAGGLKGDYFRPVVPKPIVKRLLDFTVWDHLKTLQGMATNPIKTLSAYQFELPVFQYQLFGNHFTVVNDPEMIRHCFVENAVNYTLEPIRQAILTPVLRQGLVAVEGAPWKHARRVLAPIFTPRFTREFACRMRDAVAETIPALSGDGQTVRVADYTSHLAYQVLSETLFSGEISDEAAGVMSDVADFFQYLGNVDPLDMLRFPSWIPRPTRLRGKSAVKRLRARIRALTQSRIERQAAGEPLPDDFLTRLIESQTKQSGALSLDEVEDHILTFIAAGHETTARGLSWMLYLVAHDAGSRERLEQEVDSLDIDTIEPSDWIEKLPFMVACFEETMRLYPPAPFITRMAIKDDPFGLAFVPGGGNLFLNLYALHRHKSLWDQPEAFLPERFMGEAKKSIARFQYLPFGVGHRTCIGGHFAMQEAIIILVLLLKPFRFDYAGEKPPCPVMRITLKPDNGIPMTIHKRAANA
ncbi:MAG: cytochrome P450 [Alphaproteobacteria bacterium]